MRGNYRIQATATRGVQIVVERQYEASPGNWITCGKYLTANLGSLPKRCEPWMLQVPAMMGFVLPEAPAIQIAKAMDALVLGDVVVSSDAKKEDNVRHAENCTCTACQFGIVNDPGPDPETILPSRY